MSRQIGDSRATQVGPPYGDSDRFTQTRQHPSQHSSQRRLTGAILVVHEEHKVGGAPGASRVVAELLATMISIVATILALSSEIKLKETTLDRLPSQLDLVKGGWCQMRVGQIRGGILPCLSQTGEGFLLEFDFVEKLRVRS